MFSFRIVAVALLVAAATAFSTFGATRVARSALKMADIVATAVSTGSHKTLVAALQAAKLDGVLSGSGPFCVFAPTDAAFAKLPAGTVDALLKDIPKLTDILKYHVSSNQQLPSRNGRAYATLLEKAGDVKEVGIRVTVDTCESFAMGGQANKAKITDIITCTNGQIFVIDEVLLPYEGTEPPYMAIKEPIPEGYVTPKGVNG
jgi:uncharacterized surface protein with fasciclin (FAS1) repeats